MPPKFKIAICGGGVGGLALAAIIGKFSLDIEINIYEAGAEITTVGAGIAVWKRTWQILQNLGIDDALARMSVEPPTEVGGAGFVFRKSDQEEGINFYHQSLPYGYITLHRTDLVSILLGIIPPTCTIHTSKRLTHYLTSEPQGPVILHFTDGTTANADVFVGADGVRSPTRKSMFEGLASDAGTSEEAQFYQQYVEPKWSGTLAYRFLVPRGVLETRFPGHQAITRGIIYCGKSKHVVSYPISQGRLINLIAFYTVPGGEGTTFKEKWVVDSPKEEAISYFEGWETEVQSLLSCMEIPSRWAIHLIDSLPRYTSGSVALLGDAAHAMQTHFAAAAGQAIEDAYLLGRLLAHPRIDKHNVRNALRVYEDIRLPFANNIVKETRLMGLIYEFDAPGYYQGDSQCEDVLEELGKVIEAKWDWQAARDGGPNEDWEKAEAILLQST